MRRVRIGHRERAVTGGGDHVRRGLRRIVPSTPGVNVPNVAGEPSVSARVAGTVPPTVPWAAEVSGVTTPLSGRLAVASASPTEIVRAP